MKRNGFSLIEVLVVIAIVGVLATLGIVNYLRWISRYYVENQVKELYSDIMKARVMAMSENRKYFVSLSSNEYKIYGDTDPAPNGDGSLSTTSDAQIIPVPPATGTPTPWPGKAFRYTTIWSGGGTTSQIDFNERGLANVQRTICIYTDVNPLYDCVLVAPTRIILGKLNTPGGGCDSVNCSPKQ